MRHPTVIPLRSRSSAGSVYFAGSSSLGMSVPNTGTMRAVRGVPGVVVVVAAGSFSSHKAGHISTPSS